MKLILTLMLGVLCPILAFAQSDSIPEKKHSLTVSPQHASRGEWRDGALPAGNGRDEATFVVSQTLLCIDYVRGGLQIRIAPQHSGVWGAKDGGTVGLDEGWVSLRHGSGFFATLGRQTLSYDDQRIIGANDWVMASSTHDVLKTGYDGSKHKIHLLLAFNQNSENINGGTYYADGGQPYKSMQTLWYHFDPVRQLGASLIFMNTGMQDQMNPDANITRNQQLYGTFLDWHPESLGVQASYYRQCGHDEHALKIKAWMASVETEWQINRHWKLDAGYFHMSGDEKYNVPPEGALGLVRKTSVHGFNPIFGTHHKFYGAMDFFYVKTYYGGNTPGLQDFHFGARWTPVKEFSLDGRYHRLATSVLIEDCGSLLGHEFEFSAKWELAKDVKLLAGYSYMRGTGTMERLKRSSERNRLHWGWIMLSVTPEFFFDLKP